MRTGLVLSRLLAPLLGDKRTAGNETRLELEAFKEYLACTDSNLAATVTLVATGVQPQPALNLITSLLVPGNEITLR